MRDSIDAAAKATERWRALPLAPDGRSLIEASAGTGKTWTIAAIYLRLLLEQRRSPRQIVVATFTNAAAAELKQRLRERIEGAHRLASVADPPLNGRDGVHHWLQARWQSDGGLRSRDAAQLALALAEIDFAPISTLHRLCLRALSDRPFDAGVDFQMPTLIDASSLLDEIGDDLWRLIHIQAAAGDSVDEASHDVRELAVFVREILAGQRRQKVLAKLLLTDVEVPKPTRMDAAWPKDFSRQVYDLVDKVKWKSNSKLPDLLKKLADAAKNDGWRCSPSADKLLDLPEKTASKTAVTLATPDRDAAIAELARIAEHVENLRRRSYRAIQTWARGQRDRRLQAAGQLGFDDVLARVRDGLQPRADGTRPLADALNEQWPVALIDEFQDTDPVQYAILDAIYSTADGKPRGRLALIGDPKQAIYRFRGGDIDTYERAKRTVPTSDRLTLHVNFRSSTAFVGAINTLYAWMGHRLGVDEPNAKPPLEQPRVGAKGNSRTRAKAVSKGASVRAIANTACAATAEGGTEGSPPPIAYADVQAVGDPKADAAWSAAALTLYDAPDGNDFAALKSCANVIASLLDPAQAHTLGGRRVCAADVAVLVPTNAQAARMLGLLQERAVPCANRGHASVFDGQTARELLLILDAVEHCDRPKRIRAALATRLLGWNYHRLRATGTDSPDWLAQVARFHDWRNRWRQCGALAVIAELVETIAESQLATHEGQRVLTDLRHLGELLQTQERHLDGAQELLSWLRDQYHGADGGEDAVDASALRLESDADCAQVMTLHRSKGLEFAFVFLPLMWKQEARKDNGSPRLRSGKCGIRHVVFDADGIAKIDKEDQDERFRMLYVALTRARHACHLWLPPRDATKSAASPKDAPLAAVAARIRAHTANRPVSGDIAVVPTWLQDECRLSAHEPGDGERRARSLPPERNDPLPSRHSFSTLGRGRVHGQLFGDGDTDDDADLAGTTAQSAALVARRSTADTELSVLQSVAGRALGNAMHGILENRRVGVSIVEQMPLVRAQIEEHNVRAASLDADTLADRMASRLQAVLNADLDGNGLRLATLPAADLRTEMEFCFALAGVKLGALRHACRRAGYPHLIPDGAFELHGLMTGKIDLVFAHGGRFHMLDWKSNRLGDPSVPCLEDYTPARLDAAMDAAHYRLQALLYTLALDRYLRTRLRSTYRRSVHLGDCWYLFVRAVGLRLPDGTACGVWRHRFDDELLDAMQAALSATRHAA